MQDFSKKYGYFQNLADGEINRRLKDLKKYAYPTLYLAIEYSLSAGGKRVRPVLCLAAAESLGLASGDVLPFAAAIEMIHTYSLIHDDLPCMDDDDMRRGKPSNHKIFGEGNAVLAGDALLNWAYEICFLECKKGGKQVAASQKLAECAGANGMINGQSADLDAEGCKNSDLTEGGKDADKSLLNFIHYNKTTRLIEAALTIPSILSGGKNLELLTAAAQKIGLIFQYTDDLLDAFGDSKDLGKTTGKDSAAFKLTAVKVFGRQKTEALVSDLTGECLELLNKADNADFSFIAKFTKSLQKRIK